jgi:hypothetical protein
MKLSAVTATNDRDFFIDRRGRPFRLLCRHCRFAAVSAKSYRFVTYNFHFTFTLPALRCCAICGSIHDTSSDPHTQQPNSAEDTSTRPPPPHEAEKSAHQRTDYTCRIVSLKEKYF